MILVMIILLIRGGVKGWGKAQGGGLPESQNPAHSYAQTAWRRITLVLLAQMERLSSSGPTPCDAGRILQLVSNCAHDFLG